ncbi:MAG: PQQ-binding-like beta-propeller repeat protein [Bdellovibrionota bacterium]
MAGTIYEKASSFLAIAVILFITTACGSRNLYRNAKLPENPPLERGYVYTTRNFVFEAGDDPVEFASPLATKDTIFVGSRTRGLEAFYKKLFLEKWRLELKNGVSSELLLDQNKLYFGANDGHFYAVDAEFGKVLWKYETKVPVIARPTIANGKVYFTAQDDIVYCLEQNTGKWLWHYKRGGNYITTIHGNSVPAVDESAVYVGFSDGYLVSLNAKDGNLLWEQKIHKGTKFTDVDAMALVTDTQVFVPSYDGELYALDKVKGKVLWHIDVGGSKKVLVDDRALFLASSNGHIYSIDKETGRISWKFELDEGTPTNLVQRGNYLAFGSSRQYFYAIYKGNGTLAYRHNVGLRSGFVSNPMQSGDEIFVLSNFGNLYVFRWAAGARSNL